MTTHKREIAVVGGGLAGYAAALGFASAGFDTVLVAPKSPVDGRSTALIGASLPFLQRIGIMPRLREQAEPLVTMRIVDATARLLRAPTVEFRAGEIGMPAFGYNVLNGDLMRTLSERAAELAERLTVLETTVERVEHDAEAVRVDLANGDAVAVSLLVGADGRRSFVRESAGIRLRQWSYPQTALVLNFEHEVPHRGVSTEFHTATGPFTQVPLPGRRSSLVWVEKPEVAALLADVDASRLAKIVEEKMQSILGRVEIDGPVQAFSLTGAVADRITAGRSALLGEAAHVFPPIGAQGLNLGLRDAAEIVDAALTRRDDPGGRSVLGRFERRRSFDIASRTAGVHALNRSLLADFLPVQAARSLGLSAMAAFPALRRFAMREGASPYAGVFGLPISMRTGFDVES